MKNQIKIVSAACAGPEGTTPTASMVKLQDGRLWAYGGAFCISVPFQSNLECAFLPAAVSNFFSRERAGVSLTVAKQRLYLRDGRAEVAVAVLPAADMPVLAVLGGDLAEFPSDLSNLKYVAKNCVPGSADFRQAVLFRGGVSYGCGMFSAMRSDGIDCGEDVLITPEAAQAVAANDSGIVRVSLDAQAVEFEFTDGTRIACRRLTIPIPNTVELVFDGDAHEVKLDPAFLKEAVGYNAVKMDGDMEVLTVWSFEQDGSVTFQTPRGDTGRFADVHDFTADTFKMTGKLLHAVSSAVSSGGGEPQFYLLPTPAGKASFGRFLVVTDKFEFVGALTVK